MSCKDYDNNNDLSYNSFGINMELIENEGYEEPYYFKRDEQVNLDAFNITIHRNQLTCQDIGNNPLTIEYMGKKLELKDLKNIQLFVYDADKDGVNELYIISFESCRGLYKI